MFLLMGEAPPPEARAEPIREEPVGETATVRPEANEVILARAVGRQSHLEFGVAHTQLVERDRPAVVVAEQHVDGVRAVGGEAKNSTRGRRVGSPLSFQSFKFQRL